MERLSKVLKIILGILIFLLIFGLVTFFINKKRVEENKPPLPFTTLTINKFSESTINLKTGCSTQYIGLGYKINRYNYNGLIISKVVYEIGNYKLEIDEQKNEPLDYYISENYFITYYSNLVDNKLYTTEKLEKEFNKFYKYYVSTYGENYRDEKMINKEVMKYFNTEESLIDIKE